MARNLEFTEQRTLATRAAQNTLASTWIWEEKSPAEWDADLAAFTAQRETAQDAEADMLGQRGPMSPQFAPRRRCGFPPRRPLIE